MKRARLADPLREWAEKNAHSELASMADSIDLEHTQRMENCRRSIRRDFANYLRSVIVDYEKGVSRRNRNHAHCIETINEDGIFGHARCSACHRSIGSYDRFCRHCGAKITGTDYEEEGD